MEDAPVATEPVSYKYCKVKLSLFSLIMLTALSGFCGGISWAIALFVLDLIAIITLERLDNILINLIIFPMMGAFGAGLAATIGYPLYGWIIKNIRGQGLSGTFFNPHN